jgi:hypothetical protein
MQYRHHQTPQRQLISGSLVDLSRIHVRVHDSASDA